MPLDSIVLSVISKFTERAEVGLKKYGTDLDRKDLSTIAWINHTQEELMDAILYLEKLKNQETKKKDSDPDPDPEASSKFKIDFYGC